MRAERGLLLSGPHHFTLVHLKVTIVDVGHCVRLWGSKRGSIKGQKTARSTVTQVLVS